MWIVKEDLVGKRVHVMRRHDKEILWRGIVRGVGLMSDGFRLLVAIDEVVNNSYWSLVIGQLVECQVNDDYLMIQPD